MTQTILRNNILRSREWSKNRTVVYHAMSINLPFGLTKRTKCCPCWTVLKPSWDILTFFFVMAILRLCGEKGVGGLNFELNVAIKTRDDLKSVPYVDRKRTTLTRGVPSQNISLRY